MRPPPPFLAATSAILLLSTAMAEDVLESVDPGTVPGENDAPAILSTESSGSGAGPHSVSMAADPADALRLGGAGSDSSPVAGMRVDLYSAASYIYDSNTAQIPDGPSASLFAFAFGANVKSRDEPRRGGYYGLDYKGQYFLYEDAAAAFGRNPFEHFIGGYAGINGGYTRVRLDIDYHRNNGNAFQWDRIERETRRALSNDYSANLGVVRTLGRGSLEFGAGYTLRDFDNNFFFNDGENSYFDASWLAKPSFAPMSELGIGFRLGADNFDGSGSQRFYTPSLRWRWRAGTRTSVHNSVGYETRSIAGASDVGNLVFNGGVEWAATAQTGIGIGYYRQVMPSFLLDGQSIAATGINLMVNNRLPGNFLLSSRLGYESADYFTTGMTVPLTRQDNFLRLALDLSHPVKLSENLLGEWGIFFHHNRNDTNIPVFDFEQNIFGLRLAVVY